MKYLCILLAAASCRPAGEEGAITVLAASSLKELAEEAAAEWSVRTGRPVRLQCDASSILARQIRAGAPADVFISAAPEWLDEARPLERFDWLGNRLACVVRLEAASVELAAIGSLALAGEQVPAGKYAREALRQMGIALPARVILGASARDVLSKVSAGAADAAIVYATDAAVDPLVRVAYLLPETSHPPIVYAAGLMSPAGRDVFESLRRPSILDAARRRGFIVPK